MNQDTLPDILEDCLQQLEAGMSIEACLAVYPDEAEVLRPLLEAAQALRQLAQVAPSPSQINRMEAAMERKFKPQPRRIVPHRGRLAWVALAAVSILVIVLGMFAFQQEERQPVLPTRPPFGAFHTRTPTPTQSESPTPTLDSTLTEPPSDPSPTPHPTLELLLTREPGDDGD